MMLLQLILDHSQKWLELGWLLLSEHWLDSYGEEVWVRWDHKLFKQIFSNLVCYALVLRSDIWWICFQSFNKDLLSVVVKRVELVFVPILVVLLDDICENLHTAVLYAILTLSLLVLLEDHHRCEEWFNKKLKVLDDDCVASMFLFRKLLLFINVLQHIDLGHDHTLYAFQCLLDSVSIKNLVILQDIAIRN